MLLVAHTVLRDPQVVVQIVPLGLAAEALHLPALAPWWVALALPGMESVVVELVASSFDQLHTHGEQ